MSSCRLGRAVSILVSFCIYSVNSSERGFLGSRRIKRNVVADGHKPQAPVTSPIKTVSISRVRKYARYGQTPPRDGGILKRVHRDGAKTSWVRARALHPASSVGHAWSCCCGSPPGVYIQPRYTKLVFRVFHLYLCFGRNMVSMGLYMF